MDKAKRASFVKQGRQKFAKGGVVKKKLPRKYMAEGGDLAYGSGGVTSSPHNPNTGVMGTIGQGLGLNNNYRGEIANIQMGTNASQLNSAYDAAQAGLNSQNQLMQTLNPQASTAAANQNQLAQQYLDMSQGRGPNPALAQLAQATNQNVANQASMMAGQRGAASNVGMMARSAAQQGAATQQQAVGQAATLGAQQQIAAQQNLANLSNNQISQTGQANTGYNSVAQNEQSILQNANTAANNAAVGMQSNVNNVNAQTSAANQNMNSNVLGGLTSMLSMSKGGEVKPEAPDHHKLAEMNSHSLMQMKRFAEGGDVVDKPDLGTFKAGDGDMEGPDIPATGTLPAAAPIAKSDGGGGGMKDMMGMAAMFAGGGPIQGNPLVNQTQQSGPGAWATLQPTQVSSTGPNIASTSALPENKTDFSKVVKDAKKKDEKKPEDKEGEAIDWELGGGMAGGPDDTMDNDYEEKDTFYAADGGYAQGPHKSHVANFLFAQGGQVGRKVPAMVSPGEVYLKPEQVDHVLKTGEDPKRVGEVIPGKAKVKGDSLKNDIVPKTLEEGGVVISRENMSSKDKRKKFVHKAIARKKARR